MCVLCIGLLVTLPLLHVCYFTFCVCTGLQLPTPGAFTSLPRPGMSLLPPFPPCTFPAVLYCSMSLTCGCVSSSRPPEGSGVIIAVLIICVLLLAILGSVLYFLYKKGKIPCGRSGKQDLYVHFPTSSVLFLSWEWLDLGSWLVVWDLAHYEFYTLNVAVLDMCLL